MISYLKFKREHMSRLVLTPAMAHLAPLITDEELTTHEKSEQAYTLLEDGVPILCCGAIEMWAERVVMWCYMGGVSRKSYLEMHNQVKRYIYGLDYSRIEMYVDYDFKNGHRWAKALGFKVDAPRMESFTISGSDMTMYSLIRKRHG